MGLSAGLVAWSLLAARVFDSLTDPVMGYLSDRTKTRFGRRRPYFLLAAIPLAIAFYCLFTPPIVEDPENHQGYLLLYMLALYILTYFIWTVAAIPYFSLGAELTDDYNERLKVIAVRESCALLGLVAATVLPGWLIYAYGGLQGYSFMGGILGGGVAVFLIFAAIVSRERPDFQGRPAMDPYAGWLATFKNPHFARLLMSFIFSSLGCCGARSVGDLCGGLHHWYTGMVDDHYSWLDANLVLLSLILLCLGYFESARLGSCLATYW